MPELVAVSVPPGPRFVELVAQIWDDGDAFAPVDLRLPPAARQQMLDTLQPTAIITQVADQRDKIQRESLVGGRPTMPGDALVIATSGTSGQAKAVVHTHDSIKASAHATSAALAVDPSTDKWLACLPLAHIGGLSVVLRSMVTGTDVEIHDGFDADAVTDAANRGATLVSLVTRALNQVDASLFRTVLIGGATPPASRPTNVVATYGMTETGSGVVYSTASGEQTVLDGCEIQIVDEQIMLRGPMLFRGYRSGPSPFTSDGWFPTGDLGHRDDDGRLVVAGRAGDVIVTGGEKVWPGPVERLLLARRDIAEVAVVGRPDPDWGHTVVVVVVAADPGNPPTLESMRETVKAELPAWCAPVALELRQTLPRTSLGKLRRNELS